MKVKHLAPTEKIASYVERILVIENYGVISPFALPLFANGQPTLLFKSAKATIGNRSVADLILFGQTVVPEALRFTGDFILVAYFFKPYAVSAVFGIAAQELTDKPVDLNLLASKSAATLTEKLLHAGNTGKMIVLLDEYIFSLISNVKSSSPAIEYAAGKIAADPSKEVLALLQKELYITERTFQRLFEKNIGIAPNLYRRICQFNAGFQQLNNRQYAKLSDLAFNNGYADQSHYIRAFKEFTHLTPKDYLNFG